jgi:hypothetical protein
VFVELESSDFPEVTLVVKAALAFETPGPDAVFADHMDKHAVVSGFGRPAILEVKLVVLIRLFCPDIAGGPAGAVEYAVRLYLPGLIDIALIPSEISEPAVVAFAVEEHYLLLRFDGSCAAGY